MIDQTFTYKADSSELYGIKLQDFIVVESPEPKYDTFSIPGKSGDYHISDGTFYNRKIYVTAFITNTDNVSGDITAINHWLLSDAGYNSFQISGTDYYYMAKCIKGIEYQARFNILNPFTIEFDAKPQAYTLDGLNTINMLDGAVEVEGATGTMTKTISNPWFKSRPYIWFEINSVAGATGKYTIYFNEGTSEQVKATLTLGEYNNQFRYDSETGETNLGGSIAVDNMISINPGNCKITWYKTPESPDITRFEIQPRWWHL